jgi:hypothetical protein
VANRVQVTFDAEHIVRGTFDPYRANIEVKVSEDIEDNRRLAFELNGKEVFIKKEDLKSLIYLYKL